MSFDLDEAAEAGGPECQKELHKLRTEVERLREAQDGALLQDCDALVSEVKRLRAALRQIYTGAAEPADGLAYREIAEIADKALRRNTR